MGRGGVRRIEGQFTQVSQFYHHSLPFTIYILGNEFSDRTYSILFISSFFNIQFANILVSGIIPAIISLSFFLQLVLLFICYKLVPSRMSLF